MMTGFERYTKKTRRAAFLDEMNQVVPWHQLWALIEPHYPKAGSGRGLGTGTNYGCAVRDDEAEVRVREGALPRTEEERPPADCRLCSGELVYGSQETAPLGDDATPPAQYYSLIGRLSQNSAIQNH